MIGILSQNNILVFDWCQYEPFRSNVDLILGEDHNTHFFAEKCSFEASPKSFSYGVHAKTVETYKWEDSHCHSDDPAIFQAHLLRQFKRACETIDGKFTFFSIQDRIMTGYAGRIKLVPFTRIIECLLLLLSWLPKINCVRRRRTHS